MGKKEWREDAACKDIPKGVFFPEHITETAFNKALKICATCPVTKQCLDYAMKHESGERCRYGVYGGRTPKERYLMDKDMDPQPRPVVAPITTPIRELPRWLRK